MDRAYGTRWLVFWFLLGSA